jgi:hypothetical protein
MKKILLIMLVICLAFSVFGLSGCSGEVMSTENDKPLDLVGNWIQDGKKIEDDCQAGYISGDRIEIYWMSDGGETRSLYWSGTYTPPQEVTKEYTWDSTNDKTKTDSAILASGDDQKTFTYKDGKISYIVSLMGTTKTIYLVPTETDYSKIGG